LPYSIKEKLNGLVLASSKHLESLGDLEALDRGKVVMRKVILSLVALTLVGIAAGGGAYWWTTARFFESTDNAYVQGDISVISPKVAGYVREVRVIDNQQVRAGDVLALIDDEDFAARTAEARAAVAAEQAAIAGIDRKLEWQASMIEAAKANVVSAQAELTRAQPNYERYKKMVATNIVGKSDYDQVEATLRKAEAEVTRTEAALTAEQGQLVVLQADRKQADAQLAEAEASFTLAQNDLDNTVIKAPVDGVVGNKGVQVGQYVKIGTQLMAVVPLPQVYIVANFKETQLENMRQGQPVEIAVDAYPHQPLIGTVESFAPASGAVFSLLPPENATGNFTKVVQRVPVRIAVPKENVLAGLLRPGLSVVVSVDTRAAGTGPTLAGGVFGAAQAATRD
jgi:membrane fusion protein (multidrug efflux system)